MKAKQSSSNAPSADTPSPPTRKLFAHEHSLSHSLHFRAALLLLLFDFVFLNQFAEISEKVIEVV
jgi:hypothetical protein